VGLYRGIFALNLIFVSLGVQACGSHSLFSHSINISKDFQSSTNPANTEFPPLPLSTASPSGSPTAQPSGMAYFQIPASAYTSIDLDQCPLSTGRDAAYPGSVGTGPDPTPNISVCGGNYWEKWPDVNSDGTMDLTQVITYGLEGGFFSAMFTLVHSRYGDILNHINVPVSNPTFRTFLWNAWITVVNVDGLNALELGLNHSAAGNTVSFAGVQCDFQSDKQWDVHGIGGGAGVWTPTGAPCTMASWNVPHHIMLAMHEDSSMNSYVDAIYDATLDSNGNEVPNIYAVGMEGSSQIISGFPAGLITAKFQHDGGPNATTSYQYLSRFHISAW
jgi:hypothetical protein